MNTDIRLSVEFWHHPKVKKLVRRLDLDGVRSLQILWSWAAVNRPNGVLSGMDTEDIELAADWRGEKTGQDFIDTLLDLRWLDETPQGYALHDWQEHNPWAAEAENRGDKARLSRLRQVNPAAYEQCVAEGKTAISQREYEELKNTSGERQRIASESPENASVAPAPSPSPSLINLTPLSPIGDIPPRGKAPVRHSYSQEFDFFWEHYPKKTGKDAAWRAWQAKKKSKVLPPVNELVEKIERFQETDQWQDEGGRFIPNPSTWINQGRWMDELPEPETPKLQMSIWDDDNERRPTFMAM